MSDIPKDIPQGATHYCLSNALFYRSLAEGRVEVYRNEGVWKNSCVTAKELHALNFAFVELEPVWKGGTIPPVGTVCRFIGGTNEEDGWHEELRTDMKVEVIAHFDIDGRKVVAFVFDYGDVCRQVEQAMPWCFAPIDEAAERAAEERKQAIEVMATYGHLADTPRSMAEKLYDAGYKKVEV